MTGFLFFFRSLAALCIECIENRNKMLEMVNAERLPLEYNLVRKMSTEIV